MYQTCSFCVVQQKAVISVLDSIKNEAQSQRPTIERKRQNVISIQTSSIIVNQCRIILRRAAAEDDARTFFNLLGRKIMNLSDKSDDGVHGSPAMVSRPLDFRTIDLRLAVGTYDGSQDSFLEDVKEVSLSLCMYFLVFIKKRLRYH